MASKDLLESPEELETKVRLVLTANKDLLDHKGCRDHLDLLDPWDLPEKEACEVKPVRRVLKDKQVPEACPDLQVRRVSRVTLAQWDSRERRVIVVSSVCKDCLDLRDNKEKEV